MTDLTPTLQAAGIDPGDTTGYARVELKTGRVLSLEMLGFDDFLDAFMHDVVTQNIKIVVIEDYRLDQWKAIQQSGSRFKAVQVIGAVKALCRKYDIILIVQDRKKRKIGEKWSQIPEPNDHSLSHSVAALNHVLYYLMRFENVPTAQENAKAHATRSANENSADLPQ